MRWGTWDFPGFVPAFPLGAPTMQRTPRGPNPLSHNNIGGTMATTESMRHALSTAWDLSQVSAGAHGVILAAVTDSPAPREHLTHQQRAVLTASLDAAQACIDSLRRQMLDSHI
jgi:hypothetical protein